MGLLLHWPFAFGRSLVWIETLMFHSKSTLPKAEGGGRDGVWKALLLGSVGSVRCVLSSPSSSSPSSTAPCTRAALLLPARLLLSIPHSFKGIKKKKEEEKNASWSILFRSFRMGCLFVLGASPAFFFLLSLFPPEMRFLLLSLCFPCPVPLGAGRWWLLSWRWCRGPALCALGH